jgi:hypothetical protein
VGCEASESDDELLETEGDSEGRGGRSPGSGSVIETGAGKGSVAVAGCGGLHWNGGTSFS